MLRRRLPVRVVSLPCIGRGRHAMRRQWPVPAGQRCLRMLRWLHWRRVRLRRLRAAGCEYQRGHAAAAARLVSGRLAPDAAPCWRLPERRSGYVGIAVWREGSDEERE